MDTPHQKICFVVLCGLPGVGKTSLAELLREGEQPRYQPAAPPPPPPPSVQDEMQGGAEASIILHLCYDEIIPRHLEMEMGQDTPISVNSKWKTFRQEIICCVDAIVERLHTNTDKLQDILDELRKKEHESEIAKEVWSKMILSFQDQSAVCRLTAPTVVLLVDDNMYYRSMRYEYYQLARRHSCGFCQVYLPCSVEYAIGRNSQRPQSVPVETITKMADRLQAPDPRASLWEKRTAVVDPNNVAIAIPTIWKLISDAMLDPVSPLVDDKEEKDACRAINTANLVHQADQALRKCVAKAMSSNEGSFSKAELKRLGARCNAARQAALLDIRRNPCCLPPMVGMATGHSDTDHADAMGGHEFRRCIQELFDTQLHAS